MEEGEEGEEEEDDKAKNQKPWQRRAWTWDRRGRSEGRATRQLSCTGTPLPGWEGGGKDEEGCNKGGSERWRRRRGPELQICTRRRGIIRKQKRCGGGW